MFVNNNAGSRKDFYDEFNFKIQRNMCSGVSMPFQVNLLFFF